MDLGTILFLGWRLQYLKRAAASQSVVKNESYIYDNLIWLEECINKLDIDSSINKIINNLKKTMEKYEINVQINDEDAKELIKQVDILNSQCVKELSEKIVFDSVKECMLDKSCLIKLMMKNESAFFDSDVWMQLSDIARSDFSDAAKCLLMGASTPATMITLRAAEDIVRHYYENKTKIDFTEKVWGTLIRELRSYKNVNKDLLEHLDYIRKTKRNFAQHPDKIYNQ
jgi:hypothetical protein